MVELRPAMYLRDLFVVCWYFMICVINNALRSNSEIYCHASDRFAWQLPNENSSWKVKKEGLFL